jgi:hypothetical protein
MAMALHVAADHRAVEHVGAGSISARSWMTSRVTLSPGSSARR